MTRPPWLPWAAGAAGVGLVLWLLSRPPTVDVSDLRYIAPSPGGGYTWQDASVSSTAAKHGIDNWPHHDAQRRLMATFRAILIPANEGFGYRGRITSGFRNDEVNALVGGSRTSQHRTGEALDIIWDGLSSEQMAAALLEMDLPFDQLIWYDHKPHVHISFSPRNRRQVLNAKADGSYPAALPASGPMRV